MPHLYHVEFDIDISDRDLDEVLTALEILSPISEVTIQDLTPTDSDKQ